MPAVADRIRRTRRVAILTLGFWPNQAGMELMIHNLAESLTQSGDYITLYAPKPKREFKEIPHTYLLKRFKDQTHFFDMFRRQHAIFPFDVILVQGAFAAASMALRMKAELGVPVVLRTHGEDIQMDADAGYGYRLDEQKARSIEENIRAVDRNIVIGGHIAPLVKAIAPETDVRVIHNGVDTSRFSSQASNLLRARLGLPADRLVLLMVGRNVRKKSFDLGVEALKRVVERVPNVALVHVGRAGNGADLVQVAEKCGVKDHFYALGEVDYFTTPEIYASADLFVFPSKMETFGNVTIEAMSAGLPCVEFDYGVNAQKIVSGETGYIVPHGDVEGLADRIIELLQDPERRRRFGRAARERAVSEFDWKSVSARYHAVLEEFESATAPRDYPASGVAAAPEAGATREPVQAASTAALPRPKFEEITKA